VVLWAALEPSAAGDDTGSATAKPHRVDAEGVHLLPVTAAEILRAVRASSSRAVLVNIWATWCLPCREEFPDLVRLSKNYKAGGLKVIFVSGDFDSQRSQVIEFLAAHGVNGDTYLKAGRDEEFIDAFNPDWSGALPATFIYDRTGSLRPSILERASYEDLEKRVVAQLDGKETVRSEPKPGGTK
jgi:thiol-disulfide isomerase/thioredoxin